jgi:hypothetical protein
LLVPGRPALTLLAGSAAVLVVAHALPPAGIGLWFRLNAATVVVLLSGMALARALGVPGIAAAFVWSLTEIGFALAFVFAIHAPLADGLLPLAGGFLLVLPFTFRNLTPGSERVRDLRLVVIAFGVVLGVAIWFVAGVPWGDQLFHMGRVEKLLHLNGLSLRRVDEFRDGGLHPGYAFPLWHGFLAVIARLSGAGPGTVMLHEPSALAPVAALIAFEAGVAVFRSRVLGLAFVAASLVPITFAAGRGGSLVSLGEPGAAAKQLLVPAAIALFFYALRQPRTAVLLSLAAANAALALIHPPYALFLLLALVGFLLARTLIRPRELPRAVVPLGASSLAVAGVFLWLRPIVRQSAAYRPSSAERARELIHYGRELSVTNAHRFALSPELFTRTGAFAVAALATLPLAILAAPRRWSSFVLGAGLPLFALLLLKPLFPHFAALVSLSQARRAAGFLPLPYALVAAAAVLSAVIGPLAIAISLGAGIALQLAFPGDFSAVFHGGTPAWPVWIALFGATTMVAVAGVVPRVRLNVNRMSAVGSTLAFLVPVSIHGLSHWRPVVGRDPDALTAGLISELNRDVPRGAVVFADPEIGYRIGAYAPVYVVAAPLAHVADTKANAPRRRVHDVLRFYRTGNLAIARRYRAHWIVVDRSRFRLHLRLPIAFADRRFTLFELR